jgi:hypothetical protein
MGYIPFFVGGETILWVLSHNFKSEPSRPAEKSSLAFGQGIPKEESERNARERENSASGQAVKHLADPRAYRYKFWKGVEKYVKFIEQ